MNNDILYEILKNLYKEGESALIEKLFINNKLASELRIKVKNFEKPITFEIKGKSVSQNVLYLQKYIGETEK